MAKHHILAFFAASLLSHLLLAATPVIGSEVPLVPGVELRSAAYDQTAPAAASNGSDHLVVWVDGRRLGSDIYATRVGTDGRPAEPLGRRIATGTNPKIASAGGDYLLVWQTSSGLQSIRLSADGAPLSAPHAVGTGEPVALVSNGSTYLLVTRPGPATTESAATVLDRDGVPLRRVARTFALTVGAGAYGGQYYVVDAGSSITLRSIAHDGAVTDRVLQAVAVSPQRQMIAAFAPGAVLLAWDSGVYMLVGYDGSVITGLTALPIPNLPYREIAAGWDGREFLVVFSPVGNAAAATTAFRLAADGTPIGGPLTLSAPMAVDAVSFASSSAPPLIVWSQSREFTFDIVARAVPSFSALTAELTPATLISGFGEAQGDVQIARGSRGILTVWDDADRWLRASASFNGGPPVTLQSTPGPDYIGWPAVAAGTNVFLVVWRHAALSPPRADRLLAKRFDFDGKDLDPQPLVLMTETVADFLEIQTPPQTPSIAFDGSSFVVAWADKQELYITRVGETGPVLGEGEIQVGNKARSPRALWTGNELLIGYSRESGPQIVGGPTASDLSAVRFDRSGTAISQVPPAPVLDFIGYGYTRISAAPAPDAVTFAWVDTRSSRRDIVAMQTTLDGRAKLNPVVIVPRAAGEGTASVEIAWNGSEYVLAWVEPGGRVKGIRLDARLRRLDTEPFEVSSGPGPQLPPWLITTPSGVLIAYSRADDANGGAPRVFMRALARRPAGRNRAVAR